MSDRVAVFYYVALIKGDGEAAAVDLTRRVQSFQFTDREAGMDRLRLTINNSDLTNFDDPVFERGAKLRVAWGNGMSTAPPRDMVIKKVTGGRTLTVEAATKAGLAMDTEKKRRGFAKITRADVVRKIAKEHGFNNPDIDDTPEIFEEITQGNLSDGQFMRKLAHLEGFEFFMDWSGLHWHRRRAGQAPAREYIYFTGSEILDFDISNDVTRRPGKVKVKSRDPLGKVDIEASASNEEDQDRDVMQGVTAALDPETAAITLIPEAGYEQTVASNVASQQDADREAKGKFRKAAQGAVKMTLKLRGDPSLVAKTVIRVGGLGKRVSGLYYIKEISHTLDASGGYSMDCKLITDGFQSRGGTKGGASGGGGEGAGAIPSLAAALNAALAQDFSAAIDLETGAVQENIEKINAVASMGRNLAIGLKALAKQEGDQLKSNARLAAKALSRLASLARSVGMMNTAAAAADAAATLARIAEAPDEVPAKGKLNDKTKADSEVIAIDTIDEEGNPITTYVDQNGRAVSG